MWIFGGLRARPSRLARCLRPDENVYRRLVAGVLQRGGEGGIGPRPGLGISFGSPDPALSRVQKLIEVDVQRSFVEGSSFGRALVPTESTANR